jgi:aldehyde:ferredoxin oxidoreductase
MRELKTLGMLGKILEIDLAEGKWKFKEFAETAEQAYFGGRGLNVKHLYDSIPPGTDPYGPDNILILSCGGLTGTAAPVSSRIHINALSPLTGVLGSSNVGGGFGTSLRSCGIQQLIIRGQA